MSRLLLVVPLALVMATPALAQSHSGHAGHDMSHMDDLSRFGAPGNAARAARTVTVKASEIAFDQAAIEVKAGDTILFVLENDGSQDHQLGIGDEAFFKAHADMVAAMPGHQMPGANIVTAAPGKTAKFAWTFTKAGTFIFACSMPGHADLGMKGTITVR